MAEPRRGRSFGPFWTLWNIIEKAERLQGFGEVYSKLGMAKQALPLFQCSMERYAELQGPDHESVGRVLGSVAGAKLRLGRYAEARDDYVLAIGILGRSLGVDHPEVVAMEFCASSEDMARIIHAHPTLSEAVHEAALAVDKRAIHKGN